MSQLDHGKVVEELSGGAKNSGESAMKHDSTFNAKDFARRVYRREIFTSDMIRERDVDVMPMIFLPIALMTDEDRAALRNHDITMIYGEMSSASNQSINGYPIFGACCLVSRSDHQAFLKEYKALLDLIGE